MSTRTRGQAAREAGQAREGLLDTIAALVFAVLPLSIQAITLPALSKSWKKWAIDERVKERALEQASERVRICDQRVTLFQVPLWAAKRQPGLSRRKQLLFQLRAVA